MPSAVLNGLETDMAIRTALDRMTAAYTKARAAEANPADLHILKDHDAFYKGVRRITGSLNQEQVETINGLLQAAPHWPLSWMAYGLATAWHEARLMPIREWGRGRGKRYGKPGKYGQIPYGRGLVQLTWDYNYEWADKALGLEGALLKDFDLALEPEIATAILVKGMEEGAFTKRKLGDYLKGWRGSFRDFIGARRIINGTDRDRDIANLAIEFQSALEEGGWA